MQTKFPKSDRYSGENVSSLLVFFSEITQLKQLFRQGWLRRLRPEICETVAEHTFLTAMMAWMIAEECFPSLDSQKVLRMALLHDVGEIYAGDITPVDDVSASEKYQREKAAVEKIFSRLSKGNQWLALWEEYETGASPEAQLVKQVDKLEMALQAGVYESTQEINLQEFFDSAAAAINDPHLNGLFDEMQSARKPQKNKD